MGCRQKILRVLPFFDYSSSNNEGDVPDILGNHFAGICTTTVQRLRYSVPLACLDEMSIFRLPCQPEKGNDLTANQPSSFLWPVFIRETFLSWQARACLMTNEKPSREFPFAFSCFNEAERFLIPTLSIESSNPLATIENFFCARRWVTTKHFVGKKYLRKSIPLQKNSIVSSWVPLRLLQLEDFVWWNV